MYTSAIAPELLLNCALLHSRPDCSLLVEVGKKKEHASAQGSLKFRAASNSRMAHDQTTHVIASYSELYKEGEVKHINGVWPDFLLKNS